MWRTRVRSMFCGKEKKDKKDKKGKSKVKDPTVSQKLLLTSIFLCAYVLNHSCYSGES